MRVLVLLIAVWSLLCGLVLVAFQGAAAAALGAGVADDAGQRLVGAHLLILAPAYAIIAWRSEQYAALLWLPLAGQLAVAITVGYSILTGETDFEDGMLPVVVGGIFVALLAFVWISEQRSLAQQKLLDEGSDLPDEPT
jgi:hypothetical protein